MGLIPIPPGFIGPIEPTDRIGDGDDERPMDELTGLEPGMRPLLIRFDGPNDDDDGGGGGADRGLKPG